MSDYTVLGGHENAEFRDYGDRIELYSTEIPEGEGDEIGTVGEITEDELQQVGETLRAVRDDGDAKAPDLDNMEFGQHALTGALIFTSLDDEGEMIPETGAVFSDIETLIEAADAVDE